MRARTLIPPALATAVVVALAPAAQAQTVVCNEAENSPRGGYEVSGGPVDPNPPAFLRGSQMRVGNDQAAKGLVNAAYHSPALRTCSPEGSGGGEEPPPGGGGEVY